MALRLPSFTPADPNEVLRPVKTWFVVVTLFAALALNLLPLSARR